MTCPRCGLPDNYSGDGDGIGSCDCLRCPCCAAGPQECDCGRDFDEARGDDPDEPYDPLCNDTACEWRAHRMQRRAAEQSQVDERAAYQRGLAEGLGHAVEHVARLLGHGLELEGPTAASAEEILAAALDTAREQGHRQAVAALRDVAQRTGSTAARWAADYLAADPDRLVGRSAEESAP